MEAVSLLKAWAQKSQNVRLPILTDQSLSQAHLDSREREIDSAF